VKQVNSTGTLWQKGWQTLQGIGPRAIAISFLAIFLPQLGFELVFAHQAAETVGRTREFLSQIATTTPDFFFLVAQLSSFVGAYLAWALLLCFFYLAAYFALIYVANEYNRGRALPTVGRALLNGVKFSVPRGILAAMVLLVLFAMVQLFLPPVVLVLLPALMVPVFIVCEKNGAFTSIKRAVFIGYGERFPGGRIAVMFQAMSIGAMFYAFFLLIFFLTSHIQTLDQWLGVSRAIALVQVDGLPFNILFLLSQLVRTALTATAVTLLAAYTTGFYFWAQSFDSPIPKEGIAT